MIKIPINLEKILITVRIEKDLYSALKEVSKHKNCTMSSIIRDSILSYVKDSNKCGLDIEFYDTEE